MMDWIASLPLGWAILLFWSLAIVRATTTYALARGIAAGAERTSLRRHLSGPLYLRAMRFVDRWGPWAIPLCFMTVGLQTAVISTAGITRMRWRRFIPAMLVGALIWGVIYGTVGMAVVWAVITTAMASPWAAAALVLALAGVAVLVLWRTGGMALLRASRTQRRARAVAGRAAAARARAQPDTTSDAGR
ncbi:MULTISPECIES: VTT domain-containing protein [Micrococcaceae]|uniref:DedA family protein n=1 Tax=Micrococcaceae TaxID=1268 RepID=UPI001608D2A1|nr:MULTISPECIES: VTT domain-containing protein [Micrococcaceae]MBB5750192.1 membrane protein DedA with SNARE-associated domain [Micrococcus sp. TA1]HRO93727.1 VTT domain-containing protein [Citricoccus sp.]